MVASARQTTAREFAMPNCPNTADVRVTQGVKSNKKLGRRALLADCVARCLASDNAEALEESFQEGLCRLEAEYGSWMNRGYRRASDRLVKDGIRVRGWQLAADSPLGKFLPRIGQRRRMSLLGQEYRVGYGGNGAGERYAWHFAEKWALERLVEAGLPAPVARGVWEWRYWPHRALAKLATAGVAP